MNTARGRVAAVVLGSGWRASRRATLVAGATLVGGAVTSILYPVGFAVMVDAFLTHDLLRLVLAAVAVAVLYTATWALAMWAGTSGTVLSDRVAGYLNVRIAELVNAVPGIEHFERPEYLAELDLLEENRRLLANGPRQGLLVLQVLVRILGIVVILATVYPPLGLLPLAAAFPVAGERYSVWLRQRSDERLAPERRLADELFRLTAGAGPAKELRVFGLAGELGTRHDRLTRMLARATARVTAVGSLCGAAGWVVFAGAFVAGMAVVAVRAAHGETSPGEVVLAVTLLQRAQGQVSQAANAIGQLLTTGRTARRLLWLTDYAAGERLATATATAPDRLDTGITFDAVSFAYPGTDRTVLRDVSLSLPAGAAVAVVGENGAGKTTLVKLLTGMYRPSAGRILVDGIPLDGIDVASWRERTAAAFQDVARLELLAAEAVGVGDLPRIGDRPAVENALERADAAAVVATLPAGLDSPLGRSFTSGAELSGGQWQRLGLGRGLMRSAPLLLVLDEPTANLDALTEGALFERSIAAARELGRRVGSITLLVSHRFATVRSADLIVVVAGGRVVETGDHASLTAAGGLYAELFELQARSYR